MRAAETTIQLMNTSRARGEVNCLMQFSRFGVPAYTHPVECDYDREIVSSADYRSAGFGAHQ